MNNYLGVLTSNGYPLGYYLVEAEDEAVALEAATSAASHDLTLTAVYPWEPFSQPAIQVFPFSQHEKFTTVQRSRA